MKIPSIAGLLRGLSTTLRRWPLTILLAVVTSVLLMRTIDNHVHDENPIWTIILSCYVAMLLTIAAAVFAEARGLRVGGKVMVQVVALALALCFYYWLPERTVPRVIRVIVVVFALHWLIAFLPYAGFRDSPAGFWEYNRRLFDRGLQSLVYTLVLYGGIALAIMGIEHLFDTSLNRGYNDVWWLLAGIFNPMFYLAGFPTPGGIAVSDYPRGLKVFTQFVLLPLVSVYVVILYAYLFKIIFTAHWPSGWVAYMVLGLSVAGILALLLIYPLRNDPDNRWIRSYSRMFYLALFPLILLLWVAILKRIGAYGITEGRYYVLLLSIWLTAMTSYFVFSGRKDIRLIPASLCVLALLSLFGPWSAGAVSLASQKTRMKALLVKDELFTDIVFMKAKGKLPLEDRKQLSAIADYIAEMHSYRDLQPWFRMNLDSVMQHDSTVRDGSYRDKAEALLKLMGVKYAYAYETESVDGPNSFDYSPAKVGPALRTTGVSYLIPDFGIEAMTAADSSWNVYLLDKDTLKVRLDSNRHRMEFLIAPVGHRMDFLIGPVGGGATLDLRPLERTIRDSAAAGELDSMLLPGMTLECPGYRVILTDVNGVRSDSLARITGAKGYLMVLAAERLK